jgi:hypothetical protein
MSQEVDIGERIPKTLTNDPGGEALHEGCPKGLVAALPFQGGVKEEVFIAHESFITYGDNNVNMKIHKKPQSSHGRKTTASRDRR